VRFSVEDTGIGLRSDQIEHLFDDFVQADGATTRRYGGTGLGLAIVRRLVEAMDGTIRVKSAPGQGSRFIVEIPLSRDDDAGSALPKPCRRCACWWPTTTPRPASPSSTCCSWPASTTSRR
jgi:hypothetical protein